MIINAAGCVFLLAFCVTLCEHGLAARPGGRGRAKWCNGAEAKCIWLNDYFDTAGKLELHSSTCFDCTPAVYCYEGAFSLNQFLRLWDRLYIIVETKKPIALTVSAGNSSQEILSDRGSSLDTSRWLHFNPFQTQCVGVQSAMYSLSAASTDYHFRASLELWLVYPLLAALGVLLLYKAPSFSRNVPLIYSTWTVVFVLASVLVLLYYLSRYMPGRSFLGLGFLAGGYTAVMAAFYWAFDPMMNLMLENWEFVLGYVVIAGLIGFAVIYWWGGVSNPRTFDLIKWTMQLFALFLIFFSTPSNELSAGFVALNLFTYSIPIRFNPLMLPFVLVSRVLSWCWRSVMTRPFVVPPKRFLTEEEYNEQGRVETAKELRKLREYCSQNQEEVMDAITSRARLGKFVQTGNHVTQEERVNHDYTFMEEESDTEEEVSLNSEGSRSSSRSPLTASPSITPPTSAPSSSSRSSYYHRPTPLLPRYSGKISMYHTSPTTSYTRIGRERYS